MKTTVGSLRQQTALSDADRRVVLVTDDKELAPLISDLEIVEFYPDTTDERGNWNSTFKIQVRRRQ